MVLIFDLDDTLYPEATYVEGGLAAVAAWLRETRGWDAGESLRHMRATLRREGRGRVFDRLLEQHGAASRRMVGRCVAVYRSHRPSIHLCPEAVDLPRRFPGPLYLVTDGNKRVQQAKVDALGIAGWFRRVFITHRHGIRHAKPSPYCFERIRRLERCDWNQMLYVGDNPAKDFVGIRPLGMHTVRVLTGMHRAVKAAPGHEAEHRIARLDGLDRIVKQLENRHG
jgi:putative hydrolase of the HAD superfamily